MKNLTGKSGVNNSRQSTIGCRFRIFAVHLLNDYSGSPKVLSQLARGWSEAGINTTLLTSSSTRGFLSGIRGVKYRLFPYRFEVNKMKRLLRLLYSQLWLLIHLGRTLRHDDIVYINTVLPFGAALAGKFAGCKVVYHLHESSVSPPILKYFLFKVVEWTASEVIYVSKYLFEQLNLPKIPSHILANAIEDSFVERAEGNHSQQSEYNNILMVSSLKEYKGVRVFCDLAQMHPDLHFRLVVNASQKDIDNFFDIKPAFPNLQIFPTQEDVHPHYRWASVVLNLSLPDQWVETFGLTALEAMAYGKPTIVPPVGGIAELVQDERQGRHADSRDKIMLSNILLEIVSDKEEYDHLSRAAFERLLEFKEDNFISQSIRHLNELCADSK